MQFEMTCVAAFLGGIATVVWTQSLDLRSFVERMMPWTLDVGVAALAILFAGSAESSPWVTGLLVALSVGIAMEVSERMKPGARSVCAEGGISGAASAAEEPPPTALAGVRHS